MKHYYDVCQNQRGRAIAGVTINVYLAGTTTPALIYFDEGFTPKANPLVADNLGRFDFFIADGRYDLKFSSPQITTFTQLNVEISDITSASTSDQNWSTEIVGFQNQASVATPAAGSANVYSKPDKFMYWKDDAGNEHQMGGQGAILPNTPLAFSSTPSFNADKNTSYSMTLTANVTSSTVTGSPVNGQLLSLTLTENSTGGFTFVFPANFVFDPNFVFNTVANSVNELTFKFDGTNWHLIANSGNSGGGGSPAGNNGDVQTRSGGGFGASGANDTGTAFNLSRDFHTKGPNPLVDVTMFGVRATNVFSLPQTTCTINAASTAMTLGAASSFINGDGIVCRGAGATTTLTTPTAPTVTPSSVTGPTGTGQTAANATGATTFQYCVVAADIGGGLSPCSAVTSVATSNALGAQTATVSSWSAAIGGNSSSVTVTTTAPHTMVAGTYIQIVNINDGSINGFWKVGSVPDNTHFVFQHADMIQFGQPAAGPLAGTTTVYYWNAVHITWPEVTGAVKYYVYGRTAGSMALIGVTTIQSSTMCTPACFSGNPGPPALVANSFDDHGAALNLNKGSGDVPDYVPLTPPVAAKNRDLVTKIVSGAGTTSIVVANAATNTVAGTVLKIDNVPNITAAMTAATTGGSIGVMFFPATGNNSLVYETNSALQMFDLSGSGVVNVQQAGQIHLGDMIYSLGGGTNGTRIHWRGEPQNQTGGTGSFTRGAYPAIVSSIASPMFYSPRITHFDHIIFNNKQPNQGYTWISDQGSGIPSSVWKDVSFITSGANDTMNIPFLFRGDSNGGADFIFTSCAFITGPGSQAPGVTTTPSFYGDGMSSPQLHYDTFLALRGIYFRMLPQGLQATFEKVYAEGCITPIVSTFMTGGSSSLSLELRGVVADTTGAPMFTYSGTQGGLARITAFTNVGSNQPFSNGPGGITVQGAGPAQAYGTTGFAPTVFNAQDGVMNTSMSTYSGWTVNAAVNVPGGLQFFVGGGQTTPTCSVSAGGSAPIQTWIFKVAPTFRNGAGVSEGVYGPQSNACVTSSGQQTVTVTWPAVPGAIGYDFAENNGLNSTFNVVNCAPNSQGGNSTTYIRNSNASVCGFPTGNPGGGVTAVSAGGVSSPAFRLLNNFTNTITPSVMTANRTQTTPDATGTFLLDTTTTTSAGLAPSPYDNFFRANGGLGANWTPFMTGVGTVSISSNAVISGSATNAVTGSIWTATPFLSDQYAEATIASVPAGSAQVGVGVRLSGTTSGQGYLCQHVATGLSLYRLIAGGEAFQATTAHNAAVGDRIRMSIVGNNYTCSVTSATGVVTSLSNTDANFPTGNPGVTFFNANGGSLTNFTAGTIPNNIAYVTTTLGEQQFNGINHFMGPTIFGNYPGVSTGSGLTNGNLYIQGGITDLSVSSGGYLCTDANKKYTTNCTTGWFDNTSNGIGNYTNVSNSVVITAGQFAGNTAAVWNAAYVNSINFSNDQYAAITLSTITAGSSEVDACVRMQTANFSGYCGGINTNSNTFFLKRVANAVTTTLASTVITPAVGDYYQITAVGSNITVNRFANGVLVNTLGPISDATYTSGKAGIGIFGNFSRGDNFEAGNIASLAKLNQEQGWTAPQHFVNGISLGNSLGTTVLLTSSGNSGVVAETSGTLTSGDIPKFDASGNVIDASIAATALVLNNAANTGTAAMTLDMSASTSAAALRVPNVAGASSTTSGVLSYDTTNKNIHTGANAVDNIVGIIPSSIAPANNDCVKWTLAAGVLTLNTAGAACGSGGGSGALSAITAAVGSNSINNGDNAQTWNWALTTAAKTAFKFTENVAATSGAGAQFLVGIATILGSTATPLNVSASLNGTQTQPTVSITPTWNTSGVVDAALLINAVNTASGAGSLLIDAQIGGTSQWKADKAGNTIQLGAASLGSSAPTCTPGSGGGSCLNEGTGPSAGANYDTLYGSSADHMLHQTLNNGPDVPVPNRVMLTSTYTNATTTASNITGLAFSVAASSNYGLVCNLYFQGSLATAGLDITITGPASPTSVFYSYDEFPTASTTQDIVASAFSTKLTGNTSITATTNFHATITMGLRNGANAGTVQVQGSATGTGTVTVQAGSFCVVS